jgi:hypothetical protein
MAVSPFHILRARAEARAILFGAGEFTFGEAIDPLFEYAIAAGLIDLLGPAVVEDIIIDAFGVLRA